MPVSKIHAIVYIPGLGDSRIKGQQTAVNAWKLQAVEPYLFQMNWANGEPFAPKLDRLLSLIDHLAAEGKTVSLIGASAGASAALNAYAVRKASINGLVSICGKLGGVESVHPTTYSRNPAFSDSMRLLSASTAALKPETRIRILSTYPIADESVPIADTKLLGVHQKRMPVVGHFAGIAYGLTIGSFGAIRFLKRLAP